MPHRREQRELNATVSDPVHGEFDWFWSLYRVGWTSAEGVTIDTPIPASLACLEQWVGGQALDPTGVSSIELSVLQQNTSPKWAALQLRSAISGRWSCDWVAAAKGATWCAPSYGLLWLLERLVRSVHDAVDAETLRRRSTRCCRATWRPIPLHRGRCKYRASSGDDLQQVMRSVPEFSHHEDCGNRGRGAGR